MGTIEENLQHWTSVHRWESGGEEWSEVWGGSASQWHGTVLPRLTRYFPAGVILEIGSGYGRWSQYLRAHCDRLILVDLAPNAVEACRARFRGDRRVECRQTDGRTLPVESAVDVAFSFDSLVHCEADVLEAYLAGLARCLATDGVAFLHHSNFASVLAAAPGSHNVHWRAETMSAENLVEMATAVGLSCIRQEIVDWGGVPSCDVLSILVRRGSRRDEPLVRRDNPHFMGEAQSLRVRSELYGAPGEGIAALRRGPWWRRRRR